MILKEQKVPAIVTVYFSLGSAFRKKITEGYKDDFVLLLQFKRGDFVLNFELNHYILKKMLDSQVTFAWYKSQSRQDFRSAEIFS